ncbi:hypothetical protein AALO_G00062540 [Alosa alosa]|uniref:Uncharacterized protein n=1 Tax=Alosa alosa TaxID=278164 RepID=A0AAV6H3N4_9TELE|nr:hypothetical protein AALO_G00062540 [Alosa alosa]
MSLPTEINGILQKAKKTTETVFRYATCFGTSTNTTNHSGGPERFKPCGVKILFHLQVTEAYKEVPPADKPIVCSIAISSDILLTNSSLGMVQRGSPLSAASSHKERPLLSCCPTTSITTPSGIPPRISLQFCHH